VQRCEQQELQPPTVIATEPVAHLRQATAELHRELDRLPSLRVLLRPGVTPARLASVADVLSRCFQWLDPGLVAAERLQSLPAGFRRYQPRSAWLRPSVGLMPQPPDLLAGAAYWGARYVVEGSTLGSRVILRQLESDGHPEPESLYYWRCQVAESAHWQSFRDMLNDRLASVHEREAAVSAACKVFRRFITEFHAMERHSATREGDTCRSI
jgi:heme oxygenase